LLNTYGYIMFFCAGLGWLVGNFLDLFFSSFWVYQLSGLFVGFGVGVILVFWLILNES
jgi:hypothetical protein